MSATFRPAMCDGSSVGTTTADAKRRVEQERRLAEVRLGFVDAVRRRDEARRREDLPALARAMNDIEAAFRTRDRIVAEG